MSRHFRAASALSLAVLLTPSVAAAVTIEADASAGFALSEYSAPVCDLPVGETELTGSVRSTRSRGEISVGFSRTLSRGAGSHSASRSVKATITNGTNATCRVWASDNIYAGFEVIYDGPDHGFELVDALDVSATASSLGFVGEGYRRADARPEFIGDSMSPEYEGVPFYSDVFGADGEGNEAGFVLAPGESRTISAHVRLSVNYAFPEAVGAVPVPPAAALLPGGVGALWALRRRRHGTARRAA